MITINSTNPKDFLNLFKGWTKKLPYCTAGRPIYNSETENEIKETITVEFLWFETPSKIEFKRLFGGATNFHWGFRDFGKEVKITIGDVIICCDKTKTTISYQYGDKVITKKTYVVEAKLKRILSELKKDSNKINKPFKEKLIFLDEREKWVELLYVEDFNKEINSFVYVGKNTPQGQKSTYLIPFYDREISY